MRALAVPTLLALVLLALRVLVLLVVRHGVLPVLALRAGPGGVRCRGRLPPAGTTLGAPAHRARTGR
ncbi:hypothetical protein GCM10010388_74300 [Streptomyces mauvecolor]